MRIIFLLSTCSYVFSQEVVVKYNEANNIAGIIYDDIKRPKTSEISKILSYPATGSYSPTHYANPPLGIDKNVGACNYLYFPTDGKLMPGKQYNLKLKIKFDESYDGMSFYQDNFGIALTTDLYPNSFPSYWGLWDHTNESLGLFEGGRIIEIEQEFRPLCTSKYIVLGVFRNSEMEHLHCFMCYYPFEVYELSVTESINPNKACKYFGDAFKKEEQKDFTKKEYNIYFESGSSQISPLYYMLIDSLSNKLKSSNEIVALMGHTDMSGNDNVKLGAARNAVVKSALVRGGVDSSRIKLYNLADNQAADYILNTDRRVELSLVRGEEHRKIYEEALSAIRIKNYPSAHKLLCNSWLEKVPPKKALTAIFDCWADEEREIFLKKELLRRVRSKFYGKRALNFTLDSLHHEWLKGRGLEAQLSMLRMPTSDHNCSFNTDILRDSLLRNEADKIYLSEGFPQRGKVGPKLSQVLPELILTSDNPVYLATYLPKFKTACELKELEWPYYARLYDKISILKSGLQRYGTQMIWGKTPPVPLHPFENPELVDEYRRQVKLAPFTKHTSVYHNDKQVIIDKELVKQLNNIYIADQFYRNQVHTLTRNFPKMAETDSLNQIQVRKILDERGWLGPEVVGERGNATLFLVIQHADLETQIKYLPMMRKAVSKGNARGRDLALLEDRVALGQGKQQIYGSQIWENKETGLPYVAPLRDPKNVNQRRKEIGLMPIELYLRRWKIEWRDGK